MYRQEYVQRLLFTLPILEYSRFESWFSIRHLPPVFLYKGLLCGEGLVRIKKEWKECFVVIATDTITVYSSLQAWRLRNPPLMFISLCSSMVDASTI